MQRTCAAFQPANVQVRASKVMLMKYQAKQACLCAQDCTSAVFYPPTCRCLHQVHVFEVSSKTSMSIQLPAIRCEHAVRILKYHRNQACTYAQGSISAAVRHVYANQAYAYALKTAPEQLFRPHVCRCVNSLTSSPHPANQACICAQDRA